MRSKTITYRYVVGIDCGVNTGLAIWDALKDTFYKLETTSIHRAMEAIKSLCKTRLLTDAVLVRVEDARKRQWFGNAGREKLQGAGSVKRDAKIWEDFLTDLGVDYELVAPKSNKTKLKADAFQSLTKWQGKTSEHARDAAMLCWKH